MLPPSEKTTAPASLRSTARRVATLRPPLVLGMAVLALPPALTTPAVSSALAATGLGSTAIEQLSPDVRDLAFMTGCWEGEPNERGIRIEERYLPPAENLILGTTRYLRADRAVQFEFTTIRTDSAGVFLHPHPGGRPSEHRFRLTSLTTDPAPRAVFEAPANDFPKRIVYGLAPDRTGVLVARIDNGENSPEAVEWRMAAVACGDGD